MSLYVDDFEADTAHLTLEEDGAYNRLLRLCWRSPDCSVPNDPEWIRRRLRVTLEEFERVVQPVINEFFKTEKGRVWQKRQRQEYRFAIDMVNKRKEAGSKGGRANALKRRDIDPSTATDLQEAKQEQASSKAVASTSTSISTSIKEKKEPSAPKKGTRIDPNYQPPREWSLAQGLDIAILESQLQQFKNYWLAKAGADAVKIDWDRTWQNWILKYLERNGIQKTAPRNVGELIDQRMKGQGNAEPAINGQSRLLLEGDNSGLSKGPSFLEELAREAKRRSGL